MFLSAVILILQELLEAALLISMLLVLSGTLSKLWPDSFYVRQRWVLGAMACGVIGAWLYGYYTTQISVWFDYVGLEVVNALLHAGIILFLLVFCYVLVPARSVHRPQASSVLAMVCMIVVVTLGITREGSEIILYVQGILGQPAYVSPVLWGGLMATGIGVSSGVFLFQALNSLADHWAFRTAMLLLALFAGNMAAQGVMLLNQADLLPYSAEVWNSSAVLPEYSITGQLLYALIGYEANPSLLQVAAYLLAMLLVLLSPLFRSGWKIVGNP